MDQQSAKFILWTVCTVVSQSTFFKCHIQVQFYLRHASTATPKFVVVVVVLMNFMFALRVVCSRAGRGKQVCDAGGASTNPKTLQRPWDCTSCCSECVIAVVAPHHVRRGAIAKVCHLHCVFYHKTLDSGDSRCRTVASIVQQRQFVDTLVQSGQRSVIDTFIVYRRFKFGRNRISFHRGLPRLCMSCF